VASRTTAIEEDAQVTSMKVVRLCFLAILGLLMLAPLSCGHTDEEMAQKQREIDKLTADLKAAQQQISDDQARYTDAQSQIDQMKERMKQAGLTAEEEKGKLQQALAEYKQRADQLAAIEARFRELRSRLEALTKVGLKVVVRNNRMVIQLPGDVLFDSGKDELKPQGKEVLGQVADVIRNDPDLSKRNFQVAGHTDNQKYPPGGPFHDNWGLSLARARQVLLFLVTPNAAKPGAKGGAVGGGLDPRHWAASGYGETDPQAGTADHQAADEMQKNRRVELVLQPNVEEMINLNNIK
jgi:chemotaxis protein MotB